MKQQDLLNYERIEKSIHYIRTHFKMQPDLDEVAAHVHLSPFHFQKLFTDWAGISPKKFLQYTSLQYAKSLLKHPENTLFNVANEVGLSGTGRLHDLFVNIEGMTPAEYKQGGRELILRYRFADTHFGRILVASTHRGICHLSFINDEQSAVVALQDHFPHAVLQSSSDNFQQQAIDFFAGNFHTANRILLHVKASAFQLKVWQALVRIPEGAVRTYGSVAEMIGASGASRAVGTAIGSNPVAILIPCHRVILSSGHSGEYMWGADRKTALLGWEAARVTENTD